MPYLLVDDEQFGCPAAGGAATSSEARGARRVGNGWLTYSTVSSHSQLTSGSSSSSCPWARTQQSSLQKAWVDEGVQFRYALVALEIERPIPRWCSWW
jgi:hypothetical protein